jgi:YidC/Oxa1 family membrane protein insertase
MNGLFKLTELIGIQNIGLCIILFTVVIKLLMLPLTVKQMRFSKLSAVMNPELQAIQAKYKGKSDNDSMLKMQEETKAVYAKYGTSPTGGCLQMFIQLPILFALYKVIQNIPAYVPSVKQLFMNIIDGPNGITSVDNYAQILADNFTGKSTTFNFTTTNGIVDALNVFSADQWAQLKELFPQAVDLINTNLPQIDSMNNFFGINLASNPGVAFPAILIPVLAALTQWLSLKMASGQNQQAQTDENNTMAATMQSMNVMMPIMSGIIALSLPAALGLYWISQAVCQIVQQFFINRYFDKMDMEELIKKNLEKANKKREKQGLPPNTISSKALVNARNINNPERQAHLEQVKQENLEKAKEEIKKATAYYNKEGGNKSIAERANMVAKFNEKNK